MIKYAKYIDETCAGGAPSTKNGKPYTKEMAIADGYLPITSLKPDKGLKHPVARYKIEDGKIIEYYIEGKVEEQNQNNHLIDGGNSTLN